MDLLLALLLHQEEEWDMRGAIITGGRGGAKEKIKIMESCGITIAKSPAEIGKYSVA